MEKIQKTDAAISKQTAKVQKDITDYFIKAKQKLETQYPFCCQC